MYQSTYLLALYKLCKIALLIHIKDDDRHIAFTAKGKSGLVHNLETIFNSLIKAEFLILYCIRILFRVCSIYTVNTCSLEKSIRSDFEGTEGSA